MFKVLPALPNYSSTGFRLLPIAPSVVCNVLGSQGGAVNALVKTNVLPFERNAGVSWAERVLWCLAIGQPPAGDFEVWLTNAPAEESKEFRCDAPVAEVTGTATSLMRKNLEDVYIKNPFGPERMPTCEKTVGPVEPAQKKYTCWVPYRRFFGHKPSSPPDGSAGQHSAAPRSAAQRRAAPPPPPHRCAALRCAAPCRAAPTQECSRHGDLLLPPA
eukprot:gene12534-biopygen12487